MRVKVTRQPLAEGVTAATTEEINIPAKPFLLAGGISGGVVSALLTLLTFWLVDLPKADQTRHIEVDRFHLEMVQRALQVESADGRKNSLRLLFGTGLLPVELRNAAVDSFLKPVSDTLPQWKSTSGAGGRDGRAVGSDTTGTTTR